MLCALRGPAALSAHQKAVRRQALRSCRLRHSVPFFRLMVYGWQPSVGPWDFAGVLRASLLWGVLGGLPVGGLNAYCAFSVASGAPGEDGLRPQLLGSCIVSGASFLLSAVQLATGFPAALLEMTQREMAWLEGVVRAEFRAANREQELARALDLHVEATVRDYGSARAALPAVKRLEREQLEERLRYVQALADNPDLVA